MDEQRNEQGVIGRMFGRRAAAAGGAVLGGAVLGGLFGPQEATAATPDWSVTGNAGTAASNFLGTTDNKPLVVRTNNSERLRVAGTGAVGIGTT